MRTVQPRVSVAKFLKKAPAILLRPGGEHCSRQCAPTHLEHGQVGHGSRSLTSAQGCIALPKVLGHLHAQTCSSCTHTFPKAAARFFRRSFSKKFMYTSSASAFVGSSCLQRDTLFAASCPSSALCVLKGLNHCPPIPRRLSDHARPQSAMSISNLLQQISKHSHLC